MALSPHRPNAGETWCAKSRQTTGRRWAQVGWSSSFDAPTLYEELALELRGRGF